MRFYRLLTKTVESWVSNIWYLCTWRVSRRRWLKTTRNPQIWKKDWPDRKTWRELRKWLNLEHLEHPNWKDRHVNREIVVRYLFES